MINLLRGRRKKMGLPAGTLIHVGDKKADTTRITVMDYNQQEFHEREIGDINECLPFLSSPNVTWINISGLHDTDLIAGIGTFFGLHPLILEDVLNTSHRPKIEDYDEFIFTVIKSIDYDMDRNEIQIEQSSIVWPPTSSSPSRNRMAGPSPSSVSASGQAGGASGKWGRTT
jgi:magnesium transporter